MRAGAARFPAAELEIRPDFISCTKTYHQRVCLRRLFIAVRMKPFSATRKRVDAARFPVHALRRVIKSWDTFTSSTSGDSNLIRQTERRGEKQSPANREQGKLRLARRFSS